MVMSAIKNLTKLKMAQGHAYKKVEALVKALRFAKACLRAVNKKGELFKSCFMIGTLIEKL